MVYCRSPESSTVQGRRWSRAKHIHTNIILKCCGSFWVFSPLELWGHISKSVCRNTLICTGEKQHSHLISYHFYPQTEALHPWGLPELMHRPGTCKSSTLQDFKPWSTAAKASPEAVKPGHLTGIGKQECLQTGTTKGHCASAHTSSPLHRSESTLPVLLTPPQFQVSHGVTGIRRKYNGSTAPVQSRALFPLSPSS